MKYQNNKHLFIGLGAANMYAIYYALKNNLLSPQEIVVIEMGKSIRERMNQTKKDLIHGSGGAGSFSDYKCIFSKDESQEINTFIPKDELQKYNKEIQNILIVNNPLVNKINITHPKEFLKDFTPKRMDNWNSEIDLIQSTCYHVGSEFGPKLIQSMEDYIVQKGVSIFWEHKVIDIEFDSNTVIAQSSSNSSLRLHFEYENVIIGVGRASKDFTNFVYSKLGVKKQIDSYQMGVRFECKYTPEIQKLVKHQYDFKLKQTWEDTKDSVRTFCVCNKSAYVCIEEDENGKRVNGEGWGLNCHPKYINNLTNFGIIATIHNKHKTFNSLEEEFNTLKKIPVGFITGHSYSGFSSMNDNPDVPKESITGAKYSELFRNVAPKVYSMMNFVNTKFKLNGDWIAWFPEYKEVGYRVSFNDDLSVDKNNSVYMVGDTGVLNVRGIVPSAITGMFVIDKIHQKEKNDK